MWKQSEINDSSYIASYQVTGFTAKTIAFELSDGTYLIYSAGCGLAKSFKEEVGKASYLLIPNQFHHLGLKEWQAEFPNAQVLSSESLIPKFSKKYDLKINPWTSLEKELLNSIEICEPMGFKTGELMIKDQQGNKMTWYICDIFFNMKELPKSLFFRILFKLMNAAPDLKISRLMTGLGMSNKKAVTDYLLNSLDEDKPELIVPQHGESLQGQSGRDALRELIKRRL